MAHRTNSDLKGKTKYCRGPTQRGSSLSEHVPCQKKKNLLTHLHSPACTETKTASNPSNTQNIHFRLHLILPSILSRKPSLFHHNKVTVVSLRMWRATPLTLSVCNMLTPPPLIPVIIILTEVRTVYATPVSPTPPKPRHCFWSCSFNAAQTGELVRGIIRHVNTTVLLLHCARY